MVRKKIWGMYILLVALCVPFSVSAGTLSEEIVDRTNEYRATQGVDILKHDPLLERAATLKAIHMAENGYFDHVAPTGEDPAYWLTRVGYDYRHAGENIAGGTLGFLNAEKAIDLWIESPGHRANMVSENYTHMGAGSAAGRYEGQDFIFYVQVFGTPQKAPEYEPPRDTAVATDDTPPGVGPLGEALEDIPGGYVSGEIDHVSRDNGRVSDSERLPLLPVDSTEDTGESLEYTGDLALDGHKAVAPQDLAIVISLLFLIVIMALFK